MRLSLAVSLWAAAAVVVAAAAQCIRTWLVDFNNPCEMTWSMPRYVLDGPPHPVYALYRDEDGSFAKRRLLAPAGADVDSSYPVLFVPGSGGSHAQMRSFTSLLAAQAAPAAVWGVSFAEEPTIINSGRVQQQVQYLAEVYEYLGRTVATAAAPGGGAGLTVVAHSMGGVLALAAMRPRLSPSGSAAANASAVRQPVTLFCLGCPLAAPPLALDPALIALYADAQWVLQASAAGHAEVPPIVVVSLSGGSRDFHVSPFLTDVSRVALAPQPARRGSACSTWAALCAAPPAPRSANATEGDAAEANATAPGVAAPSAPCASRAAVTKCTDGTPWASVAVEAPGATTGFEVDHWALLWCKQLVGKLAAAIEGSAGQCHAALSSASAATAAARPAACAPIGLLANAIAGLVPAGRLRPCPAAASGAASPVTLAVAVGGPSARGATSWQGYALSAAIFYAPALLSALVFVALGRLAVANAAAVAAHFKPLAGGSGRAGAAAAALLPLWAAATAFNMLSNGVLPVLQAAAASLGAGRGSRRARASGAGSVMQTLHRLLPAGLLVWAAVTLRPAAFLDTRPESTIGASASPSLPARAFAALASVLPATGLGPAACLLLVATAVLHGCSCVFSAPLPAPAAAAAPPSKALAFIHKLLLSVSLLVAGGVSASLPLSAALSRATADALAGASKLPVYATAAGALLFGFTATLAALVFNARRVPVAVAALLLVPTLPVLLTAAPWLVKEVLVVAAARAPAAASAEELLQLLPVVFTALLQVLSAAITSSVYGSSSGAAALPPPPTDSSSSADGEAAPPQLYGPLTVAAAVAVGDVLRPFSGGGAPSVAVPAVAEAAPAAPAAVAPPTATHEDCPACLHEDGGAGCTYAPVSASAEPSRDGCESTGAYRVVACSCWTKLPRPACKPLPAVLPPGVVLLEAGPSPKPAAAASLVCAFCACACPVCGGTAKAREWYARHPAPVIMAPAADRKAGRGGADSDEESEGDGVASTSPSLYRQLRQGWVASPSIGAGARALLQDLWLAVAAVSLGGNAAAGTAAAPWLLPLWRCIVCATAAFVVFLVTDGFVAAYRLPPLAPLLAALALAAAAAPPARQRL